MVLSQTTYTLIPHHAMPQILYIIFVQQRENKKNSSVYSIRKYLCLPVEGLRQRMDVVIGDTLINGWEHYQWWPLLVVACWMWVHYFVVWEKWKWRWYNYVVWILLKYRTKAELDNANYVCVFLVVACCVWTRTLMWSTRLKGLRCWKRWNWKILMKFADPGAAALGNWTKCKV